MSNSSIWPIDRTISCATTPGLGEPGSNGNEGVLYIPESSRTGASQSDGLMSYPGHSLRESYPSAVGVFYNTSRLSCRTDMCL